LGERKEMTKQENDTKQTTNIQKFKKREKETRRE
jgi:hypothetical protein